MINKKGYTLIEILSTIVLIALLLGLGIPGVMKISENMKKRRYNTKVDLIEQAGILWGQDNKTRLQSDACIINDEEYKCKKISIDNLIGNDYLEADGKNEGTGQYIYTNPKDNTDIVNTCVYIYKKNNRVYAFYPENDTSCNDNPSGGTPEGEPPSEDKTLAETIMEDARITKNNSTPTFNGVATTELGMFKAPDDYGDSWYFRGK